MFWSSLNLQMNHAILSRAMPKRETRVEFMRFWGDTWLSFYSKKPSGVRNIKKSLHSWKGPDNKKSIWFDIDGERSLHYSLNFPSWPLGGSRNKPHHKQLLIYTSRQLQNNIVICLVFFCHLVKIQPVFSLCFCYLHLWSPSLTLKLLNDPASHSLCLCCLVLSPAAQTNAMRGS